MNAGGGAGASPESTSRLTLLDVDFLSISMPEALDLIRSVIEEDRKEPVSFVNADCLNISSQDQEYQDILGSQSLVFPDGAGVNIACRMIGERLTANLNGTDLLPELWRMAASEGFSFYLLGAEPGVAERMRDNLEDWYPGIKVIGQHHGYFDHEQESETIIKQINVVRPNILLVAFGAPAQEKWIHDHGRDIDSNVLIGVGGLFDFYSGDKARAPMWMRSAGLEWMHRMYLDPARLWRRYMIGNPLFLYRIWRWKQARRG